MEGKKNLWDRKANRQDIAIGAVRIGQQLPHLFSMPPLNAFFPGAADLQTIIALSVRHLVIETIALERHGSQS